MIHPHTALQFINDEIGHGIVATKKIPAGTITWVLDKLDMEFTPEEVLSKDALYQDFLETYCYRNHKGNSILCWDHARFVNHSFNSNCLSTAYDFEVAIRDIERGEQLTDDYGYLNVTTPFRAKDEGSRRKTVYPNDLLTYHKKWDKQLLNVFPLIPEQEQLLKPLLLEKKTWNSIMNVAQGKQEMQSILSIYFPQEKIGVLKT